MHLHHWGTDARKRCCCTLPLLVDVPLHPSKRWMKKFQKQRVQSHSNIICLCRPGGKTQQPVLAAGAGRLQALAGFSAPRAAGAVRAVNLTSHRGEIMGGMPPPPPTMVAGQPESLWGIWEEMGKMETARRPPEETCKQKPATTNLDYSILFV